MGTGKTGSSHLVVRLEAEITVLEQLMNVVLLFGSR